MMLIFALLIGIVTTIPLLGIAILFAIKDLNELKRWWKNE